MIPMQWSANVKLPYYGWFGRDGFASLREARRFVAETLREARHYGPLYRPTYGGRCYTIRQSLLLDRGE